MKTGSLLAGRYGRDALGVLTQNGHLRRTVLTSCQYLSSGPPPGTGITSRVVRADE
jgi:hypothetical protein